MKPQAILDIECYPNFFLVMFMRIDTKKTIALELTEDKQLDVDQIKDILSRYEVITFNGNKYDLPLLSLSLTGATNRTLKAVSDDIIGDVFNHYQFEKEYKIPRLKIDHIDLIELTPGKASLKLYGARLHCVKLQDLPYDPNKPLTREQMNEVRDYCVNDLTVTEKLLTQLKQQINIRREMSNQYNIDLRSKSDSQIAEAVIKREIFNRVGIAPGKPENVTKSFLYQIPEFIETTNSQLTQAIKIVTTCPFTVCNGQIEMPKELLTLKLKIGKSTYQMGMGGLHSTEKSVNHKRDHSYLVSDWDVASYYPAIILNCGLYPPQMGKPFLDVYQGIVNDRLVAKANGDRAKSETLKITINGAFGKLGSKYSSMYAPELMVQVTVTGQLALLMLIASLELKGIPVVSGNTDGIVLKCPVAKEGVMIQTINDWENITGFVMERNDYLGLYSRDVNNYIAVKENGLVKTKGCFSKGDMKKNPANEICNDAVINYILDNKPFIETIKECDDIRKFLTIRNVKGGAIYEKQVIGKSIRWYYSKTSRSAIYYDTNNNQVPRTFGAKPLMDLPNDFPKDVNYEWYEKECHSLLSDLGIKSFGQQSFDF